MKKTSLALACCLLSGCALMGFFQKGAMAIDDWQPWTGYNDLGRSEMLSGTLFYYPGDRQNDYYDDPKDGSYPGLLISKDLAGEKWEVEFAADYKFAGEGQKWLSFYAWLGDAEARPSLMSPRLSLALAVQRASGGGKDLYYLRALPDGGTYELPGGAAAFRLSRRGDLFSIHYSMDGRRFHRGFETRAAVKPGAQRVVIGGHTSGEAGGTAAGYRYVKVNGTKLWN